MYNISIRVASAEAGGKLQLLYNNETVGDIIYIPDTGGWRSWQNINVGEHYIASGEGVVRLNILDSEFNIKDINFTFLGEPQTEDENYGNYPNPFTYETKIYLSIPERTTGSLTIYNYKGQLVKELINGDFAPGKMEVSWNGNDYKYKAASSGVYIYQLKTDLLTRSGKMLLIK